jgi:hypothetical protein
MRLLPHKLQPLPGNQLTAGKPPSRNNSRSSSAPSRNAITADVVNKGLVLVYAKEGSAIQSLPYESEQSKSFWYYQVAEGSLLVSADVYGTSSATAPEVRYFVFTGEQVNEIEKSGTSKAELMNLSYEQASALAGK